MSGSGQQRTSALWLPWVRSTSGRGRILPTVIRQLRALHAIWHGRTWTRFIAARHPLDGDCVALLDPNGAEHRQIEPIGQRRVVPHKTDIGTTRYRWFFA